MEMGKSIGISLQIKEQIIDLQVPTQITIGRLKEILAGAFRTSQIQLPSKFEILVRNKPIRLKEEAYVADYPLSEGDQLVIREMEAIT